MGILDQLSGPIMQEVIGMVTKQKGGLGGLVKQLTKAGLGDQIGSWIGMGENKEVDSKQLSPVIGKKKIKEIAAKLGISEKEAADMIAKALPQVVDKMTPNGKVEEASGGVLGDIFSKLKGMFG